MEFSHWQQVATFFPQHCTKGIVALWLPDRHKQPPEDHMPSDFPLFTFGNSTCRLLRRICWDIDVWCLHTCFSVSHVSITTRVVSSSSTMTVLSYISSIETHTLLSVDWAQNISDINLTSKTALPCKDRCYKQLGQWHWHSFFVLLLIYTKYKKIKIKINYT